MCVGPRIRQYIESCGITQVHISVRTGIPLSKLQSSLNGQRHMSFEEYELVCGVLGVGMDKFIVPRKPKGMQSVNETAEGQTSVETEENK